jgi:hypothetical protein
MFWNAPTNLLPFDEYFVEYGPARVQTNSLMSAVGLASKRARRDRCDVEITRRDGSLLAVARCGADDVPVLYWSSRGLDAALSGMVVLGAAVSVAICVATLMRLA